MSNVNPLTSTNTPLTNSPAPVSQPVLDARGRLTPPWLRWVQQLFQTGVIVEQLRQNTSDGTLGSVFGDFNPRDFTQAIQDVLLPLALTPAFRDFMQEIQDAYLKVAADQAQRDFSQEIQDAYLKLASDQTQRDFSQEIQDAYLKLAADTPTPPVTRDDLEDLRRQIAMIDPPLNQNQLPSQTQLAATYFNVRDYGATGNGSTDDSTAILAAVTAANAAGGGCVFFPNGTYLSGTIPLYSNVHFLGASIEASTIKLKAATNSDLFQGTVTGYTNGVNGYTGATALVNIAAPAGTGNSTRVTGFSIRNLALDGNMANQSGYGAGIRAYCSAYWLQNLHIHDFWGDGIYVDFNPYSFASSESEVVAYEPVVSDVRINNCGYDGNSTIYNSSAMGIRFAGPTDSQWSNITIAETASHAIHIGPNGNSVQANNVHTWGYAQNNAIGWLVEGGAMITNSESEGASYGLPQVAFLTAQCSWIGGRIFPGSFAGTSSRGIQLGQQAGDTPFVGSVNQSTPGSLSNPPSSAAGTSALASLCIVNTQIADTYMGAFWLRTEHYNSIRALVTQAFGSLAAPASAPSLSQVAGGSLTGQGTLYVKVTYVNGAGETTASPEASLAVSDYHELVVASPPYVSGMSGWNVYIGTGSGTEKKQNSSPIAYGSSYTLTTAPSGSGSAVPGTNSTSFMLVVAGNSNKFDITDNVDVNASAVPLNYQTGAVGVQQYSNNLASLGFSAGNGKTAVLAVNTSQGQYAENQVQINGSKLQVSKDYYANTAAAILDHFGTLYLSESGITLGSNTAAQTLTNNATITVYQAYTANSNWPQNNNNAMGVGGGGSYHFGKIRVTAASAVTGLIMQVSVPMTSGGTTTPVDGTETTLVNESSYPLTFASSGSNLSQPGFVIAPSSSVKFIYDSATSLWVPQWAGLYRNPNLPEYFTSGNVSWQEFQLTPITGTSASNDSVAIEYNGRTSSSGTDVWGSALSVAAQTGIVTIGNGLNLPSTSVTGSPMFSGGAVTFVSGFTSQGTAQFTGAAAFLGGVSALLRTISSSATLNTTDFTVLANAASGAITLTLPSSPANGQVLNIKKIDSSSNAVTIAGTIDTYSSAVLALQGTSLSLQYDGSQWRLI